MIQKINYCLRMTPKEIRFDAVVKSHHKRSTGTESMDPARCKTAPNNFLNLDMPGWNGRECLKEIQVIKRIRRFPFGILTTFTRPDQVQEVFEKSSCILPVNPVSFHARASIVYAFSSDMAFSKFFLIKYFFLN
jgi:DNA-binding NarL/FixJ family response regulator